MTNTEIKHEASKENIKQTAEYKVRFAMEC